MESNLQSYYAIRPARRHYYNDGWDSDEQQGAAAVEYSRDAADDECTMQRRARLAVGDDHKQQHPLIAGEGHYDDGDVDLQGGSQESYRRGSCSYSGENESIDENNDYYEENCHDGEGKEFARGNDVLDERNEEDEVQYEREDCSYIAGDDESSMKENHDGNYCANEYYDGRGHNKNMARGQFHDQRQGDSHSRDYKEQSFLEDDAHQQVRDGKTKCRSPLREGNLRESYSYSDEEPSLYENDGCCHDHDDVNVDDVRERPLDDIDFNQIQRPHSMLFDDDDKDHYDADGEHHNNVDPEAPIKEVSFVHGQSEEIEYQQHEHALGRSHNDDEKYDENSSLDSEDVAEYQPRTKPLSEPIFHSSESLDVIQRIESVMESCFKLLDKKEEPIIRGYVNPESYYDQSDSSEEAAEAFIHNMAKSNGDPKFCRSFGNIAQSRSFTSICLVMSFIHQLLQSNRTTTTREVYYVFVTHFRNQRECDGVILDVGKILGVSRRSLGLSASPKGWFCGCVEITRKGTLPSGKDISGSIDGTALSSIQGLPITREWTERDESGCTDDGVEIKVTSKNAKVILVVEKEGVYNRLSEERIFDRFPCILVTGKGFPDLATRALVNTLHRELELPVVGLCDCNPYGVSVLSLYHCAGDRMGVDGRRRYSVPIQWLGLRPSAVARLKDDLPETVFQQLTDLDNKRAASLLDAEHSFLTEEDEEEVRNMEVAGYKVELEALYWLGPDYMGNWVVEILKHYDDELLG